MDNKRHVTWTQQGTRKPGRHKGTWKRQNNNRYKKTWLHLESVGENREKENEFVRWSVVDGLYTVSLTTVQKRNTLGTLASGKLYKRRLQELFLNMSLYSGILFIFMWKTRLSITDDPRTVNYPDLL